jgi:peptidoglycan/xylan/chitin deacetylase (PgdA/CDA1 family)
MARQLFLTTSWDDGDPADLRLAETLARYGQRGTFYLCRDRQRRPRLKDPDIRELATFQDLEIGSHTLTHPNLTRVSGRQADAELRGSKAWLEDLTGQPVTSFCYPNGRHGHGLARRVADAGYLVGRTTASGHSKLGFDPLRMPTTMQLYPHGMLVLLRHALKERDLRGFLNLAALRRWSRRPAELASLFVERSTHPREPVAIHVWGHSWELDEAGLWPALHELLAYLRELGPTPKTNRELVQITTPDRVA